LLLQSALLQQIVDGAAFAQISFRYFNHRLGVIGFGGGEVVFYVQLLFASTHLVAPG